MSGMVSNGRASTIFIAEGIEPVAMAKMQENFLTEREKASGLYSNDSKKLDPNHPEIIELSKGLVEMLHLAVGDQAMMLVSTLNGQANASDITVGHSFTRVMRAVMISLPSFHYRWRGHYWMPRDAQIG